MSNMAMKYEDWLRECVHHDGEIVYLPCDIVLAIADWIEAHRDAVPVIWCKDCKHRIKWKESYGCSFWGYYGDEFADGEMFCSKGKRKENDD